MLIGILLGQSDDGSSSTPVENLYSELRESIQ
jgi:hypothetical protein